MTSACSASQKLIAMQRQDKPNLNELYPITASTLDDSTPRRLYGKVKRVGDKWVTPDGKVFYKQHLAYKNLHEQLQIPQLEPLKVQEGISLIDFFSLDLDPVIKSNFGLKLGSTKPSNQTMNIPDSFVNLLSGKGTQTQLEQ